MPRRGLARARPDLRAAENGRLATLHLQFAIGAQSQIALCRTVARLRVISGSALLFGGAALEALQHNQAFQPLLSRAGVGVLHIAMIGVARRGEASSTLPQMAVERKRDVVGKRMSVRVDLGGPRTIKKKKTK